MITDGNTDNQDPAVVPQTPAPAPAAASVDAEAVVEQIVARLGTPAAAASPQGRNEIADMVAALKAADYSDDWIQAQITAVKTAEKIVERKLNEARADVQVSQTVGRVRNIIDDVLAEAGKDDKRIRANEPTIRANLQEMFQADRKLQAKYANGSLSRTDLEDLADEGIDKWYQDTGLERAASAASPAIKPAAASPDVKPVPKGGENLDDLPEDQQTFGMALAYAHQHYLGKNKEDATKFAAQKARALPKLATR